MSGLGFNLPKGDAFKAPRPKNKNNVAKAGYPSLLQSEGSSQRSSSNLPTSSGTAPKSSPMTANKKTRSSSSVTHSKSKRLHFDRYSPSASQASMAQSDVRSSLSPEPGNGLDSSNQVSHTLSKLEVQVNKVLSALTVDVCAHKDTKKAVNEIVDLVTLAKSEWITVHDDKTAIRADNVATTLWNNVLAFRAGLEENARGVVLHTIALLRYAASVLFQSCRMGTSSQIYPDEVMLAHSRTAIDLFAADRVALAEEVLTSLSAQITVESNNHHNAEKDDLSLIYKESRTLFWIARCLMARKVGAGGASDYIHRALIQSIALPPHNLIVSEVMTTIQDMALERLDGMQGHEVNELENEELKEIMVQLETAIGICEKRQGTLDGLMPESVLNLKRAYARSLVQYGWANSANRELEKAEHILSQLFMHSYDANEREKASSDGLLLLFILEDRLASLDLMLRTCQVVLAKFVFNDDNVSLFCELLQRRAQNVEATSEVSRYCLAMVDLFVQSLSTSQHDKGPRSRWMTMVASVAFEAMSPSDGAILQSLVDKVDSCGVDVDEETATSWLQMLRHKFTEVDEKSKRANVAFLAVATSPVFVKAPSTLASTLKFAIYHSLNYDKLPLTRGLLGHCVTFADPVFATMDCYLGIKENDEEHTIAALNNLCRCKGTTEAPLMALLDEILARNMLSVAPSIMHMLLNSQRKDSHTLKRLTVLRAAIKSQVRIIQNCVHREEAIAEMQRLEELSSMGLDAFSAAADEDRDSVDKAAECDWAANFLYCFSQDMQGDVPADFRTRICSTVVAMMQIRFRFAAAVPHDLLRVNLWASITLLTGEINAAHSSANFLACLSPILKAADECQEALMIAQKSGDVGYDYDRFRTVIVIGKAEALLKAKQYEAFSQSCLPSMDNVWHPLTDDLEEIALLLTEYPDAPVHLLETTITLMLSAPVDSYETASRVASWVHRCLKALQERSPEQLLYVRIINFLRDGFVRCLRATRPKTHIQWPGDTLSCIVTDVWQVGKHLIQTGRQDPGFQLLQIAIDIEDFNITLAHKSKQARKEFVDNLFVKNSRQ